MKKTALILICMLCLSFVFSQESSLADELQYKASLAMSSSDYKVTAGDVYSLVLSNTVYPIIIDTTYKMRVANLSVIDVAGKTFLEVKALVEQIISRNYPMSGIQFTLQVPAAFKVIVNGEVASVSEHNVWALSRLSSVVGPQLTSYSSTRNVIVTSQSGKKSTYDLFKASRDGDLSQNPYLRPGDVVTVQRLSRRVTIAGAVERPGTYELLEGENLKDLVEKYASNVTPVADTSRIELIRYVNSSFIEGEKLFLSKNDIESNISLEHLDSITIQEITDLIPVMFLEGAVYVGTDIALEASNKLAVRFYQGENYASLARRQRASFSAVSDLENAYIIRGKEYIPINLNPILYDVSYRSGLFVEKNDILLIPFKQFFISVSGAVITPGRYPYIPDRNWEYYVALAGGIDKNKNNFDTITITNIRGERMSKSDAVTPESIIHVKTNSFLYFFNQYAPVITTILSIVSTVFTVMAVTKTSPLP